MHIVLNKLTLRSQCLQYLMRTYLMICLYIMEDLKLWRSLYDYIEANSNWEAIYEEDKSLQTNLI